jgi:3-oxoacyl-[acyl-carrier protein] reductase
LELNNKIAVVTGGSSGLGLSIAKMLKSHGAQVLIFDTKFNPYNIEGFCGYNIDVTNNLEIENTFNDIYQNLGTVDILINNVGIIHNEPFINLFKEDEIMHSFNNFKKVININLNSIFLMTSAFTKYLATKRKKGVIVNISSICSKGNAGQVAYSSSKAAVNALTVTLSKELGPLGIRCNAVSPGFINTQSTKLSLSENHLNYIEKKIPLKKLGEPEDVALAVISLITNEYINGTILEINGGLSL